MPKKKEQTDSPAKGSEPVVINKTVIVLDHSALERLIGNDPQLEVALKQAAVATLARRHVVEVSEVEAEKIIKQLGNLDAHVRKVFADMVIKVDGVGWGWNKRRTLTEDERTLIKERCTAVLDTERCKIIDEVWNATVRPKIVDSLTKLEQQAASQMTALLEKQMSPEELDKMLARVIKARLLGV